MWINIFEFPRIIHYYPDIGKNPESYSKKY